MKTTWMNSVLPIALIFSFRMLGLFMLIPVFSVYATTLQYSTPILIGIALGSYGLSQGLLQMPLGFLSDKYGRKPIITIGLIFFALGSFWGAITDSIYGMIAARILQGSGAIGSVLIALLADLTPDQQRTKSMAVIGATIGISFSIAMIISPGLTASYGLSGIFVVTTILAVLGLTLLHLVIPTPKKEMFHYDSEASLNRFASVFKNSQLQRLNFGIFSQHFILTATFFAIPLILTQQVTNESNALSLTFYLPILFFSFLIMMPFIYLAERKRKMRLLFLISVCLITGTQFLISFFYDHWYTLYLLMFIYFIAFNFLEATLPSIVSRQSGDRNKGTAMGIYSTSQFLGIFLGGCLSGLMYQKYGFEGIFATNTFLAATWIAISYFMNPMKYEITLIRHLESTQNLSSNIECLKQLNGVNQVVYSQEEQTLYIQIQNELYAPGSADEILNQSNNK